MTNSVRKNELVRIELSPTTKSVIREAHRESSFRYTNADWAEIDRSLGQGDRKVLRMQLETAASTFLYPRPIAFLVSFEWDLLAYQSACVIGLMQRLQDSDDVENVLGDVLDRAGRTRLLADLLKVMNRAGRLDRNANSSWEADGASHAPRRPVSKKKSSRTDEARDRYLSRLLLLWREFGGALKTSVDASTGKTGGPLVRFLTATGNPVLPIAERKKLTAAAARRFIRKAVGTKPDPNSPYGFLARHPS